MDQRMNEAVKVAVQIQFDRLRDEAQAENEDFIKLFVIMFELDALCTPESFVTHSNFDTPGGTVYYIPKVYADVLLVKGNVYDSVDDCVVAYMKYAAEAGFVVSRSCQKRLRNEDVKQKFKHFPKRERQMTFLEQAFIVKAASVNIGETRAHHLLTGREFGDVVSFNATFKTNKYNMVFVPFTAINNHRKCFTVAAGLLKNKTKKSYIWLLKAFINDFGKAPSKIVTDQDRAMRNAMKLSLLGRSIGYACGTSPKSFLLRSESENSFFFHFTNSGLTLMNFMNCFETTMKEQRHVQERMDHKTIDIVLKINTFLKIERHASNVQSRSLFELV
nr:protein FAR1-related sequence 5-like [Tanacetum cinerariifolium]